MTIHFFNIKFKFSFLFFAVISVMLLVDKTGYSSKMLLSILFHELGHIFAMFSFKCSIKEILLILGSVEIKREICSNYILEIIISFSGPLINFIIFLVFKSFDLEFSIINLFYCLINLIPIHIFDGGEILKLILTKYLSLDKANKIIDFITLIFGVSALILGLIFITKGIYNLSLIIISFYLIFYVFIK